MTALAGAVVVRLDAHADVDEWRTHARALLQRQVPPEHVTWCSPDTGSTLFGAGESINLRAAAGSSTSVRVPSEFLGLAGRVIAHRDTQRFALLYRMLWRLTHEQSRLLALLTDPDVQRARILAQAVKRDAHKMKAFVRFREVSINDVTTFIAWFEPEHYIVDYVAPFFVRRFTGMRFSILTPYRSAHWDLETLEYGQGLTRDDAPTGDAVENWWRTYYASIFNPARLNVKAMQSEMPQKYWKNLPEAELISKLIIEAPAQTQVMIERAPTTPRRRIAPKLELEPEQGTGHVEPADRHLSLGELRARARECRSCPLWQPATQTVFGEGPDTARTVFIGEQPGDKEDLSGKPFVGPAGQLFNRALQQLGIDRASIYVTNTVKHFKFEPRGKIRLHMRANAMEQLACRQWLDAELAALEPTRIVCLGAMAAQAIFGKSFRLMSERGQWRDVGNGAKAFATVHPSYLLRLPERERENAYEKFIQDLSLLQSASVVLDSCTSDGSQRA